MTVDVAGGGAVVPYDPDMYGNIGLEDVEASDLAIPRLQIVHKDGTFKDSLSGAIYPSGTPAIVLGLIKQRVFWKAETDEGDVPLCKSPDFEHGFPNLDPELPRSKQFPWDKSNFQPGQAVPVEISASGQRSNGWTSNGFGVLPCSSCIFKEWDRGDWKQPPCAEQHTYPLLVSPEEGIWQPMLYTVQKTGIKPSRTYVSSFAQAKLPMFSVYTILGLTLQRRGSVDYSVPTFSRGQATDKTSWLEYANQYRSIREFVQSAPRRYDDGEGGGSSAPMESDDNVNRGPASVPTVAAPVPAASTSPTAPTPSAPVAAATAPATPTPSPAPQAPSAPSPTSGGADDDDLPF